MTHRVARASVTIQRELGPLISTHLKDPRLHGLVSVTRVELAPDLSTARVYVSTLGGPGDEKALELTVEALRSAAGHLAHELESRIKIRRMPRLIFMADDRITLGEDMSETIDRVIEEDRKLRTRRENR